MERQRLDTPARRGGGGQYFGPPRSVALFSSGCCLLDCCLGGGWVERIVNVVGDRSSGKTLLACEAAANYLRKYPKGKVWYREVEAAFDVDYITALGIPAGQFDMGRDLLTVEDVFEDLEKQIKKGRQGLYVIDSLDALSDRAEQKRDMDEGTYGAEKAKKLSQLFRRLVQGLGKSKIMVMVISQVRDKIGVQFGERHTRAGGRALDFYASQVVMLSQIKTLKRDVDGVTRPVGVLIRAKVKKNKVGLPFREVDFPLLFGFGVEDVMAGAQWLKDVGRLDDAELTPAQGKLLTSLRKVQGLGKADYDAYRKLVVSGVKKAWADVEAKFAPGRLKY